MSMTMPATWRCRRRIPARCSVPFVYPDAPAYIVIGGCHEPRAQQVQGLRWGDVAYAIYRSHLVDQLTDGSNPPVNFGELHT